MRSKACSRVIRLSNEDCSSFLQQPPAEMDVSENATVLDLNEYEISRPLSPLVGSGIPAHGYACTYTCVGRGRPYPSGRLFLTPPLSGLKPRAWRNQPTWPVRDGLTWTARQIQFNVDGPTERIKSTIDAYCNYVRAVAYRVTRLFGFRMWTRFRIHL